MGWKPSDERYWWAGDLSVLRVYDRVLTDSVILTNFSAGMISDKGYTCGDLEGDLNGDCIVDFLDIAHIVGNWAKSNWQGKWPYKVLFNNDTTNMTTCVSPYHSVGEPFTEALIQPNVAEVAATGAQVFMINPGHTWTPWWQSDAYPMKDHYQWYEQHYGLTPSLSYNEYVLGLSHS